MKNPRSRVAACLAIAAPLSADAASEPPGRDCLAIVDSLMERLVETHPDPFHRHPREVFDEAIDELLGRCEEMSDAELAVGLLRVLALVADGHTTLADWWRLFPRLPIRVELFPDGVHVVAASAAHADLVGARIESIGTTPIAAALERVAEVFAADNEWHRLSGFAHYLTVPAVLHAQGLVPDPQRFVGSVRLPDGTARSVSVPLAGGEPEWRRLPANPGDLPLHRREGRPIYWYEVLADAHAVYCRYDSCAEDPARPFAAFVDEMMRRVDEEGLERFVIDLRNNGGGASLVLRPLIEALEGHERLAQPGRVFALIGRSTFSSAMMNAYELRRRAGAVLVGEPTGGKPNSFGEIVRLPLEGSSLRLQCSTRFFRQVPEEDPAAVFPDLDVPVDAAAYFAGEDPVLAAALAYGEGR